METTYVLIDPVHRGTHHRELLRGPSVEVALTYRDAVDALAEVWGVLADRQRAMLSARTSRWETLGVPDVEVIIVDGEVVTTDRLDELDLVPARAAIRHILNHVERDGPKFGVAIRYATRPLAARTAA